MKNPLAAALFSDARSVEISEDDDIYGRLVGRWTVEVRDYEANGDVIAGSGEWAFGRVLEGRAIQDVWIAPEPAARSGIGSSGKPIRNRYGTSLRYFDTKQKIWRVIWVNPVSGVQNELTGRRVGNDIVQVGVYSGRSIRWCFRDITPDSFRWTGESLGDDAMSWNLEAEFLARRLE
jgi:hypothetical protein